jgi:catechol 2,3-dioxygenase-like lactoylglutathione lyase family enzyme
MSDNRGPSAVAAMRVARPTTDVGRIRAFYENVIGLTVLWAFTDHDGFDGVIFGVPDGHAQLELVRSPHGDLPAPSHEDALVLYGASTAYAEELVARLRTTGTTEVLDDPELNPYWPRNGACVFEDPDGYRLIIATAEA